MDIVIANDDKTDKRPDAMREFVNAIRAVLPGVPYPMDSGEPREKVQGIDLDALRVRRRYRALPAHLQVRAWRYWRAFDAIMTLQTAVYTGGDVLLRLLEPRVTHGARWSGQGDHRDADRRAERLCVALENILDGTRELAEVAPRLAAPPGHASRPARPARPRRRRRRRSA